MRLSDVWEYIKSLNLAEYVYMGKMDGKQDKSIGVYDSKHGHAYQTAIGGPVLTSYGVKYVTFLIHWNKSPSDTEMVSMDLFKAIEKAREVHVNNSIIKFIQPLVNEPVSIDTDDNGIYEMVIEAAIIYAKGESEK